MSSMFRCVMNSVNSFYLPVLPQSLCLRGTERFSTQRGFCVGLGVSSAGLDVHFSAGRVSGGTSISCFCRQNNLLFTPWNLESRKWNWEIIAAGL